jgi:hypothetical protein
MADKSIGGFNLYRGFPYGNNDWKDEMDQNLLKMSVLTQGTAKSRTAALPASAADGSVYIEPSGAGRIVVFDDGDRCFIDPSQGAWFYIEDTDTYAGYVDGIGWRTSIDPDAAEPEQQPLVLSFFVPGNVQASLAAFQHVVSSPFALPEALTGSKAYAATAPTGGDVIFEVRHNGQQCGSIHFTDGANVGSFTMPEATTFAVGSILAVVPVTNTFGIANVAASILVPVGA